MAQATDTKAPAPAPEMSDEEAPPMPKKINWGGIIKGALVITAVVVVGFVGFHVLSGVAASVIAKSTVAQGAVAGIGGIASSVAELAGNVWGSITGGADYLWRETGAQATIQPMIEGAWNGVKGLFTPSTAAGVFDAQKALATNAAGVVGAAAAVSAALPVAKAALANTAVVVPDTAAMMPHDALPPDSLVAGHSAAKAAHTHHANHAAHHQANLGKLGHHAAEHHDHDKPAAGSWQATVGKRPAPLAAVKAPPAASHAEQLKQDAATASTTATPSMA
jgi:hypothetical protein